MTSSKFDQQYSYIHNIVVVLGVWFQESFIRSPIPSFPEKLPIHVQPLESINSPFPFILYNYTCAENV